MPWSGVGWRGQFVTAPLVGEPAPERVRATVRAGCGLPGRGGRQPGALGVHGGCGREQRPGVRVSWAAQHTVRRPLLDDQPAVHDRDRVREPGHDGEVVADEQERHAAVLEPPEQVENLRLDGDVQSGRGLVREQQRWTGGDRGCDQRPLPQATGKLVRVLARTLSGIGNTHVRQQGQHPAAHLGPVDNPVGA